MLETLYVTLDPPWSEESKNDPCERVVIHDSLEKAIEYVSEEEPWIYTFAVIAKKQYQTVVTPIPEPPAQG